jgi:hypothetical protein
MPITVFSMAIKTPSPLGERLLLNFHFIEWTETFTRRKYEEVIIVEWVAYRMQIAALYID